MKRIKWILLVLVVAAFTGFAGFRLVRPADMAAGNVLVGYWATYGDMSDEAVFDPQDAGAQCLLQYVEGEDRMQRIGSAFGNVHQSYNLKDRSEEYGLSAMLFLVADSDAETQFSDIEVELEGDVVESLRAVLANESMCDVTAYVSQHALELHGAELMAIAAENGCTLTLSTKPPLDLRLYAVYQRADGSLYADGNPQTFGAPLDGVGFSGSATYSETVNGVTKEKTVTVGITVQVVSPLSSVRVVEMSAENKPLCSAAINGMDETYEAGADCAYVVVEETHDDHSVSRFLYNRSDVNTCHTRHYPLPNGFTDAVALYIRFQ